MTSSCKGRQRKNVSFDKAEKHKMRYVWLSLVVLKKKRGWIYNWSPTYNEDVLLKKLKT